MPVNFQAMLLQPNKKSVKKLREVLHELYKHLDSSAAAIIDVSAPWLGQWDLGDGEKTARGFPDRTADMHRTPGHVCPLSMSLLR